METAWVVAVFHVAVYDVRMSGFTVTEKPPPTPVMTVAT